MAIQSTSFLDRGDDVPFHTSGRRLRRWVERAPIGNPRLRGAKPERGELVAELLTDIVRISRAPRWSQAAVIEIRENDGMSWSAEMVRTELSAKHTSFDVFAVRNETAVDRFPVLARIIGEQRILDRAVEAGLADVYFTWRSWRVFAITILFVLALSAKELMSLVIRDVVDHPGPNMAPALLSALFAAGIIAVFAQWMAAEKPVRRRQSKEKFRANLETLPQKSEYAAFVDSLAKDLARMPEPRFVIIDNYEAVDELTQSVIEQYFRVQHEGATYSELWAIFEGEYGDRFSNTILGSSRNEQRLATVRYRQEPLTPDQRRTLADLAGEPARATFSSVKAIARGSESRDEWMSQLLQPLRSKHSSPLTLPYFFLLAMEVPDLEPSHRDSPLGTNVFFSWDWLGEKNRSESGVLPLESLTAEKTRADRVNLHATLLAAFFGRSLTKSDVDTVQQEIREKLAPLLVDSDAATRTFAVSREAAVHLFEHAGDYALPERSIAKLFWALAIANRKNMAKAFWSRRVIHHLLEVEVSTLPDALRRGVVLTELRNLALNMVDNALKACLTAELTELIRFTRLLLDPEESSQGFRKLLRLAWQAYQITGAEEILREVVEIHHSRREADAVDSESSDSENISLAAAESVFSQSVVLLPQLRTVLESSLFSVRSKEDAAAARDYALARGCWLSMLAVPFLAGRSRAPEAFGIFNPAELRVTVRSVADRAIARLSAGEEADVNMLDVATLSIATWCTALLLDRRYSSCCPRPLATLPQAIWTADGGALFTVETEETFINEFRELVKLAGNATAAATLFIRNARRANAAHFLAGAMSSEICATALASVWVAHALLTRLNIAPPDVDAQVRSLLAEVDETLATQLAAIEHPFASAALRERIDELLRVTAMVWQHFSIVRMSEFTILRRVHAMAIINHLTADDERQNALFTAIEPMIREQHFSGLAANLILATSLRDSAELSAIHLTQAAVLAKDSSFGPDLQATLALTAALYVRHGQSGRPIIEAIVRPDKGSTQLSRYLDALHDDEVLGVTLRLDSATALIGDADLQQQVAEMIRARAERLESPAVRTDVDSTLELSDDRLEIRARKGTHEVLMAKWNDRKHVWAYAALLLAMRNSGMDRDEVSAEALQLLQRDPALDRVTSWYHLALDVAEELDDFDEGHPAVRYVRSVARRFEDLENAETNFSAYGVLQRAFPNNPAYAAGLVRAQKVRLKRDRWQRLPMLIEQGKYFLLFSDHVEHMRVWGLQVDRSIAELFELRREATEAQEQWLKRWIGRGRTVPDPVRSGADGFAVSIDFLMLGELLLNSPFDIDQTYERDRRTVNEKAFFGIPRLLNEMPRLHHIPQQIQELLRQYTISGADPDSIRGGASATA
jgi:hypothetical protein